MIDRRQTNIDRLRRETWDVLIVGGGINGAGIARDAAGRGLKVALFEQGDLAAGTSSASSKLIHGGLRYLQTLAEIAVENNSTTVFPVPIDLLEGLGMAVKKLTAGA